MLEPDDIKDDASVQNQNIFGLQSTEHILYPIEMAKLARLCISLRTLKVVPCAN